MPRPRFAKLPPERRRAILDVAADELAAHGFQGASYNRIIERAGLSKGVAYYYFDGKEDLYLTVLEDALGGLIAAVPPLPEVADAEAFWAALDEVFFRIMAYLEQHPREARLARGYLAARSVPQLAESLARLEAGITRWFDGVLARGQAVGAVRTDLPRDLLAAVALGAGEAGDVWMLSHWDSLDETERARIGAGMLSLYRRMLAP